MKTLSWLIFSQRSALLALVLCLKFYQDNPVMIPVTGSMSMPI
jgi:hypothetical protein